MRNERRAWVVRVGVALVGGGALMGVFAGAAWSAEGWTAYVANSGGNAVTTISTATNTAIGTAIIVGAGPAGVAITPDGKTGYVAISASGTVTPISTARNVAGSAITVGSHPQGVAITPDGKTAYITNFGGTTVTPISTATNSAGSAITVGMAPFGVAITPDGNTAYVANFGSGTVTPISTATKTAGTAITVGTNPNGVAITPDGKTAYVTNYASGTVTPISTATNTAGTAITVGLQPEGVAITPDGKTAYVANNGGDSVTPINTATNTAGSAITVGIGPEAVAITPDGNTAYVTNFTSRTVTPINTATSTAGTAIPVGIDPVGVAITPDQAPSAAFSLLAGSAGSRSSFDGSASSSLVGSVASYQWDFGDGQTATTTSPLTSHVYPTAGTYTARLTVTDSAGNSLAQVFTGQTVSLQGGPQASISRTVVIAPAPTLVPLTLTRVTQSHTSWREGNRLATFAKSRRKPPPLGTTFSFALNERARVRLAFIQRTGGRKVNGSCVAQTKTNRKKASCKRTVTRGTLAFAGHAALNRVGFQGRISASGKLKPGRYTLAITATNTAGQRSNTTTLSFTIVK